MEFQRELDTAVWFGIRCVTLPKNLLKSGVFAGIPNDESTKANISDKLYVILLPHTSH